MNLELSGPGHEQAPRGASPPEDFLEIRGPGLLVWIRKGFSFLLDERGTWQRDRALPYADETAPYAGRGKLFRLSLEPGHDGCALVRHYQRGGAFQHLLRDFYLGQRRFLQEVRIAEWAKDHGVPTAEVLALRSEHLGFGIYRADLVTREIEESEDLDRYLQLAPKRGGEKTELEEKIIPSVARLLQRMHRAGLYHADLNLKNILVQVTERGVNSYVIDLDRARVINPLSYRMRIRNLVRLYRSLDKQGYLNNLVGTKDVVALVRAYCGEDKELLDLCKKVMRKNMWLLHYHRAGWKLSRGFSRIRTGSNA